MKKLYATLLVLCATFGIAIAQETQFIDKRTPDHVIEFGLHVGEGVSTILQNYSDKMPNIADFQLTPGNMNTVGASVEMPFRNYLSIGTGLDFTISNYHMSMTLLDAGGGTLNTLYTRNHFYGIDVPIYLGTRFNLGRNVQWANELGAYMNFAVGHGSSKTHAYASSTNSLGQSQVTEMNYHNKYYKDEEPIINGVTTTDYGLHVATGMRFYKHFSLKAVFHLGLRNLAINYGVLDISNHTINLAFKAGYIF